ncbi:MAG: hypothetical protein OXH86_09135 [Acidimicrobiaceae bacterium]|nr:hypothetical protein [Acidimicrobiaceae bacterium]
MTTRVAVLLDYQNAYHGAREAFGDPWRDAQTVGHIDPQRRLWNQRLDRQRYEYVRDGTDCTIAT